MKFNLILSFLLLSSIIQYVNSLKILCVLPTLGKSHWIIGSSIAKALAEANHEVTVISPFPLKSPVKNYRDIDLSGLFKVYEGFIYDY